MLKLAKIPPAKGRGLRHYDLSIVASKPVRARLLCATLSLVLPVTFGDTGACRCAALAPSAAIQFFVKNSAPFFAVKT